MSVLATARNENVTSEKLLIAAGFICPPAVFLIEGVYASVEGIIIQTHQKRQLLAFLQNAANEETKNQIRQYLLDKLKTKKEILNKNDAPTHESRLALLVNKVMMYKTAPFSSFASAVLTSSTADPLSEYQELLDFEFHQFLQVNKGEAGSLLNLDVEKLIVEFNKCEEPIAECKKQIEVITSVVEAKSNVFYSELKKISIEKQELENRLRKIEELARQKNAQTTEIKNEVNPELSSSMENIMQAVGGRSEKLAKLRTSTNEIFEVDEDLQKRKQMKEELKEMESTDLEEQFSQSIRPLQIERLRLQSQFENLKSKQRKIVRVIQFKMACEKIKNYGIHALCCFTFVGAYPRGIYRWIQLNKPVRALPAVAD